MAKSNHFFSFFKTNFILVLLLNLVSTISINNQGLKVLSQNAPKFALCNNPDCEQGDYYVGYKRTNQVNLSDQQASLPPQFDVIFLNTSNLTQQINLPNLDEQLIDLEDGNFVSSLHRIDRAEIGFLRKSELLNVHTLLPNSWAQTTVKLFWGDRLRVTSAHLPIGTPVTLIIERSVGGFGSPVTDYAFYQVKSKTYINGQPIRDLDFSIQKDPGLDQNDQIVGEDQITYFLEVRVGDIITIESLLEVKDGVNGDQTNHQMLNGADSVAHKISLREEQSDQVCILSASGELNSGNCASL